MAAMLAMAATVVTVTLAVTGVVLRAWVMEAAREAIVVVPPGLRAHHSKVVTTVASVESVAAVAAIS